MMRRLCATLFAVLLSSSVFAQTDSAQLYRIADEVLLRGRCYEDLRTLCKKVGHRLSGSPGAVKAVQWGEAAMKATGADRVWLQPVDVPHWVRGAEYLTLDFGAGQRQVPMLSLGNSQGTGGKPVTAPVVMVRSFAEFDALPAAAVKGKAVFFNYRFRQDVVNTFEGYSDAGPYRWRGPNRAAARGAAMVIIRSISTGADDEPHTGSMRYADTVKPIPAAAIGNLTADKLELALTTKPVYAQLMSNCRMVDTVRSYNVVGEIRGSEKPEEIVLVGGHLDSWDVGEGAHDDGAGCVQSIEVLRTLKALGIRPKRTVRAVLFMNEENGVRGGNAYADSCRENDLHIFALESDAGGFSPRGFSFDTVKLEYAQPQHAPGDDNLSTVDDGHFINYAKLFSYAGQLAFLNLHQFTSGHGGTDIEPLKRTAFPTVLAGLSPDPQRYFDLHHTAADVFEQVNHRELKMGAAAMTGLVWLVAEHGL